MYVLEGPDKPAGDAHLLHHWAAVAQEADDWGHGGHREGAFWVAWPTSRICPISSGEKPKVIKAEVHSFDTQGMWFWYHVSVPPVVTLCLCCLLPPADHWLLSASLELQYKPVRRWSPSMGSFCLFLCSEPRLGATASPDADHLVWAALSLFIYQIINLWR